MSLWQTNKNESIYSFYIDMRYLFIWDILSNFTSIGGQIVLLLLTLHCNYVFLIVSDETKFSKEAKKNRVSAGGPRDAFFRELSGTDISVYDRIPDDVLDERGPCQGFSIFCLLCLIEQKWHSKGILLANRRVRQNRSAQSCRAEHIGLKNLAKRGIQSKKPLIPSRSNWVEDLHSLTYTSLMSIISWVILRFELFIISLHI